MNIMHVDRYEDYAALLQGGEVSKRDFVVTVACRTLSQVAVIAPHGGRIELETSEIARQIAGKEFNLYLFEGIKKGKGNINFETLHITSSHFDEPRCLKLLSKCSSVVAIHGCSFEGECVLLGGLDHSLQEKISLALRKDDVCVETTGNPFLGLDARNICNRGRSAMGVQLELTLNLRRNKAVTARVINAVRTSLLSLAHC